MSAVLGVLVLCEGTALWFMCSGGSVNSGATEGICVVGRGFTQSQSVGAEQCAHVILRDAALMRLPLSAFVHRQCCSRGVYIHIIYVCTYIHTIHIHTCTYVYI